MSPNWWDERTLINGVFKGGGAKGIAYAEAITATGGRWGSICDNDYTTTLEAIRLAGATGAQLIVLQLRMPRVVSRAVGGSFEYGSHTSLLKGNRMSGGMTPMTVQGRLLTLMTRPRMFGSPP